MLSQRYQHRSDELWKQYREGIIDSSTYTQLLEQNKNDELANEDKKYLGFLTPDSRERIENEIWEYENRQQIIREHEAQRKAEKERRKALSPSEIYREDIPQMITQYRQEANHYRRIANWLQIIIIVGSVLVTSATSAAGFGLFGDIFRWVAPIISIVVAASAGLTGYFKFKERSFNLQRTADAIEQEYKAVILGRGYYKGKQSNEALELFTDRVESLIEEQILRQQQLEQPSDMKQPYIHA